MTWSPYTLGTQDLSREQLLYGGLSTYGASGREAKNYTRTPRTQPDEEVGVVEEVDMRRTKISKKATRAGRSRPVGERGRAEPQKKQRETESKSAHIYIWDGGICGMIYRTFSGSWPFARGLGYSVSKAENQQQCSYKNWKQNTLSHIYHSLTSALQCSHKKTTGRRYAQFIFPPVPSECHGYAPYRTPEQ